MLSLFWSSVYRNLIYCCVAVLKYSKMWILPALEVREKKWILQSRLKNWPIFQMGGATYE